MTETETDGAVRGAGGDGRLLALDLKRGGHLRAGGIVLLCLAVVFSGTVAIASATPAVTLRVSAIPIPGFPGTGDILGAGAEVESQVTISGSEYGGFPSPMTGLNVYAPAGIRLTTRGFATCAPAVLEARGPIGCPRASRAGPPGVGLGVVAFGGETVPEHVSIQEFFAPGGSLSFYVEGNTPASFQILEKAHWVTAGEPFGRELQVEVPLVETVPGANDASVLSFKVKVGAAYKKGGQTVSYITSPRRCPRDGFPVKMELKFLSGETVTAAYTMPCPATRSASHSAGG